MPLEPPDNDQTDTGRAGAGPRPGSRPGVRSGHRRRPCGIEDLQHIPEYHGVRAATYTYVEYVDGDRELYDLRHDPYELTNVYDHATRATQIALGRELAAVSDCRGRLCRTGDARPAVSLRFRRTRPR